METTRRNHLTKVTWLRLTSQPGTKTSAKRFTSKSGGFGHTWSQTLKGKTRIANRAAGGEKQLKRIPLCLFFFRSESSEKKYISVCYKKKKENSNEFPRERKENVLHFTLFKENWETNQLFGNLYKILRIRSTQNYSFKIAGTKDKRGRTCQRVSIKYVLNTTVSRLFFWPPEKKKLKGKKLKL